MLHFGRKFPNHTSPGNTARAWHRARSKSANQRQLPTSRLPELDLESASLKKPLRESSTRASRVPGLSPVAYPPERARWAYRARAVRRARSLASAARVWPPFPSRSEHVPVPFHRGVQSNRRAKRDGDGFGEVDRVRALPLGVRWWSAIMVAVNVRYSRRLHDLTRTPRRKKK